MSDCDELQEAAQALLDVEEAYRHAPTLGNTSELARARRQVMDLLKREPSEP